MHVAHDSFGQTSWWEDVLAEDWTTYVKALDRVESVRGRRLAESLHQLEPTGDAPQPAPQSEWQDAIELLDMRKVAPQSWFAHTLDGLTVHERSLPRRGVHDTLIEL